jgi:hypothetical protein
VASLSSLKLSEGLADVYTRGKVKPLLTCRSAGLVSVEFGKITQEDGRVVLLMLDQAWAHPAMQFLLETLCHGFSR